MDAEVAKLVVEAGENIGHEIRLHEDYSGRGMFGKTTTGIVFNSTGDLLASVASAAADLADEEMVNEMVETFGSGISQDNLGHDTIVY